MRCGGGGRWAKVGEATYPGQRDGVGARDSLNLSVVRDATAQGRLAEV